MSSIFKYRNKLVKIRVFLKSILAEFYFPRFKNSVVMILRKRAVQIVVKLGTSFTRN